MTGFSPLTVHSISRQHVHDWFLTTYRPFNKQTACPSLVSHHLPSFQYADSTSMTGFSPLTVHSISRQHVHHWFLTTYRPFNKQTACPWLVSHHLPSFQYAYNYSEPDATGCYINDVATLTVNVSLSLELLSSCFGGDVPRVINSRTVSAQVCVNYFTDGWVPGFVGSDTIKSILCICRLCTF